MKKENSFQRSAVSFQPTLEHHRRQTERHVSRLEQVFRGLGKTAKGKTCNGIKGILDEGDSVTGDTDDPAVRDAGIIASCRRVEHYEMAANGSVRTWAQQLGDTAGAQLLQETLDEEKMADKKLTDIAISTTNQRAQHATAGS